MVLTSWSLPLPYGHLVRTSNPGQEGRRRVGAGGAALWTQARGALAARATPAPWGSPLGHLDRATASFSSVHKVADWPLRRNS
jgi:hypothetical protein